jgi:hypothetical protein
VLPVGLGASTTEVEDVNGGLLGVLAVSLTAATTEVEDVDGRPPGGCCRLVWEHSPPKLKKSMVDPLGGAGGISDSGHPQS